MLKRDREKFVRPAVLCHRCHDRMHAGGYRSFLDFWFDNHAACPEYGGRHSLRTFYGMPSDPGNIPPWLHTGGCCVSDEECTARYVIKSGEGRRECLTVNAFTA